MREVATTMAIKYPNVFEDVGSCDAGNQFGYGLGGKMGKSLLYSGKW